MTYFHIRATSHTPNLLEWMMLLYKTKGSQKGQSAIRLVIQPLLTIMIRFPFVCVWLACQKKNLAAVGKLDS